MPDPSDLRGRLSLLERELSRIEALTWRETTPELREELEQLSAELEELRREWGSPDDHGDS